MHTNIKFTKDLIKKNEGIRLIPYYDTVQKLTIGYGFNIEETTNEAVIEHFNVDSMDKLKQKFKKGIAIKDAEFLLDFSYKNAVDDCETIFMNFYALDYVRQAVLIDMAFNLGRFRLRKFVKFIRAMHEYDYQSAYFEMFDSKWAVQVKGRAIRNAYMILLGEEY